MDVVGYTDCQQFLRDWLAERNQKPPKLSYEAIARDLGLRSRGHAFRIFNHPEVPISSAILVRLMDLVGLQGSDREYFEALVAFNRSTRMDEKRYHLDRLESFTGSNPRHRVSGDGKAYLSEWYLPVLREAVCMPDFQGDFKALGKSLCVPLSEAKVKKGVEILLRLGLLRKLSGERYVQSDAHVHAGSGVEKVLLSGFQQQMLKLASQALDGVEAQNRHITTLTFSFPAVGMVRLKKLLTRLQEELVQEILKDHNPHDSVWQFNLQLFPLMRTLENKEHENVA